TATRRRTHLKPSQVAVLQETFVTNTLPDAALRCQLAQELGVSERTVQIWFQNRRAKARKLEASSPGADQPQILPQHYQPIQSCRSYMATPEYHQHEPTIKRRPRSCSKPEKLNASTFMLSTPPPHRAMSEGISRAETANQDKCGITKSIVSIPVHGIRIGTWARFARQILHTGEWDLICFSDPSLRQLIWQVQDGGHLFRIEVSFDHVQQICLGQIQPEIGQLDIDINPNATISFSMQRSGIDHDWVRCNDFTENQQASQLDLGPHALQGPHDALRQSLLELISQAPELAGKLVILPDSSLGNPLCRNVTMSPSVTPEPSTSNY
ncbi:hypothetical protein BDF20DRAFT_803373, partial [Mycotypha africana]|uniref:uncharacterized protein n=1 Tax=Mycotypha africana TaxID=64632 RepID=UPI00230042AD